MQYLTKQKFEEFTVELEQLKTVRRREVAQELEYSKSLGDLSENAEYHQARENQMNLEERINKLEALLKDAAIVEHHEAGKDSEVDIGSIVTVTRKDTKTEIVYTIVGSEEADITQNKLSISAPMASAMLGKKKNDTFSVRTPKGEVVYTITKIA